jgi:hypothetical protein
MKIDIYTHVMPSKYKKALYKYADKFATEKAVQDRRPVLTDNEARLRFDLLKVSSRYCPTMLVEEIVCPERRQSWQESQRGC